MGNFSIGILGIGAVGGYVGGKLAHAYAGSDVDIVFLAREATAQAIAQDGFYLRLPSGDLHVHPHVSADGVGVEPLDVLICAPKSYHLVEALQQFSACIAPKTLLVPLLNGVDASEKIKSLFPQNTVADGCVYLVARKTAPNEITQTGDIQKVFFGIRSGADERFSKLHECLLQAGINSTLSSKIETDVWEKYLFIATIATATTYFDQNIGGLLTDPTRYAFMQALLSELCAVALAHGIQLPPDAFDLTLRKIHELPHHVTTSMHSDAQANRPTEYQSITGYVTTLGKQTHTPTPTFDVVMHAFHKRNA